jgi:hypothetical protein
MTRCRNGVEAAPSTIACRMCTLWRHPFIDGLASPAPLSRGDVLDLGRAVLACLRVIRKGLTRLPLQLWRASIRSDTVPYGASRAVVEPARHASSVTIGVALDEH